MISNNRSIRNFNANIERGWHNLIAQLKIDEKCLNEMQYKIVMTDIDITVWLLIPQSRHDRTNLQFTIK